MKMMLLSYSMSLTVAKTLYCKYIGCKALPIFFKITKFLISGTIFHHALLITGSQLTETIDQLYYKLAHYKLLLLYTFEPKIGSIHAKDVQLLKDINLSHTCKLNLWSLFTNKIRQCLMMCDSNCSDGIQWCRHYLSEKQQIE